MAKKNDPNYKKLCGDIPKELFLEFKKTCIDENIDMSTALELIVSNWVASHKK